MRRPLVTVAMPVRDCEATICAAVRSILKQTFKDWELLLIDDGSSDRTISQVGEFQDPRIMVYHDGKRNGLPARLNEAIAAASGQYLARMDGDDISYPRRLELQIEYLLRHEDVDLVGGASLVFGKGGQVLGKRVPPERHPDICKNPHSGFPICHPTYCGKIGWFRRYWYSEAAVRCEDQDMLLRAYRHSRFANIPEVVLGYREERIHLDKIIRSRRYFARMLLAEHVRNRQSVTGCRAALEQYAKAAVDILAVLTHAQHRLLRHRARPVTSEDSLRWRDVLRAVAT